jgi:hypothetical protein
VYDTLPRRCWSLFFMTEDKKFIYYWG